MQTKHFRHLQHHIESFSLANTNWLSQEMQLLKFLSGSLSCIKKASPERDNGRWQPIRLKYLGSNGTWRWAIRWRSAGDKLHTNNFSVRWPTPFSLIHMIRFPFRAMGLNIKYYNSLLCFLFWLQILICQLFLLPSHEKGNMTSALCVVTLLLLYGKTTFIVVIMSFIVQISID